MIYWKIKTKVKKGSLINLRYSQLLYSFELVALHGCLEILIMNAKCCHDAEKEIKINITSSILNAGIFIHVQLTSGDTKAVGRLDHIRKWQSKAHPVPVLTRGLVPKAVCM